MMHRMSALTVVALVLVGQTWADSKDLTATLKSGAVELKSAGPLAMGPEGILFVGDPKAAAIYAIDTGDRIAPKETDRPKVEGIDEKVASLLGTEAKEIQFRDVAVNPMSGTTYLSVSRGKGPTAPAVLLTLSRGGKLAEMSLKEVKSAKTELPNANTSPDKRSGAVLAITDLAYVNGRVLVAGLSNEEFASTLRAIPFPFDKTDKGAGIKIYHGAHGAFETRSPVRVFAPYKIGGEDHILAAYTCTPLVKIPVDSLKAGQQVTGTTVAELGNRNNPLAMIVYNKGGKDYVLMANSSRGLMKINLEGVDKIEGITKRISDKAGLTYDTIKGIDGMVQRLDAFDKDHVVVLVQEKGGRFNLETMELP